LAVKVEAAGELLVNPKASGKEIFSPAVTDRLAVLTLEAFVRLALKVVVPEEVILRGFAELLVIAAPMVMAWPAMVLAVKEIGPLPALKLRMPELVMLEPVEMNWQLPLEAYVKGVLIAIGPTELTVREPAPAINVVEVVAERVTPPVPAERLTVEPVKLSVAATVVLRVTFPEGPRADKLKAPPPVTVTALVMEMFPVVAVSDKAPEEAGLKGPGIEMAFVPAGCAPVIDKMADPDVARVEVVLVENVPALSALPAMKVPVPVL
jgi:hypothetical protein